MLSRRSIFRKWSLSLNCGNTRVASGRQLLALTSTFAHSNHHLLLSIRYHGLGRLVVVSVPYMMFMLHVSTSPQPSAALWFFPPHPHLFSWYCLFKENQRPGVRWTEPFRAHVHILCMHVCIYLHELVHPYIKAIGLAGQNMTSKDLGSVYEYHIFSTLVLHETSRPRRCGLEE